MNPGSAEQVLGKQDRADRLVRGGQQRPILIPTDMCIGRSPNLPVSFGQPGEGDAMKTEDIRTGCLAGSDIDIGVNHSVFYRRLAYHPSPSRA